MAKIQYYNIHYPFTSKGIEKFFVDLDSDSQKAMQSDIMHVIFTPKGQRIRNPKFGTNLIKYLFNPNDNETWTDVKAEIKTAVAQFVPNVTLTDLNVYANGSNGHGLVVEISYSVNEDNFTSDYTIITNI
jgi:phage baseplate assembly protein W